MSEGSINVCDLFILLLFILMWEFEQCQGLLGCRGPTIYSCVRCIVDSYQFALN